MGTTFRLFQLAAGVLLFHVVNSVLQEAVFHLPGFDHSVVLSFMQSFWIAALALIQFWRAGESRRAPILTYICLSVFSTVSVILTNEASKLLNYPTQVIFKSSKLLFVMALRVCTVKHKKRTTLTEGVAAIILVVGLVFFTYATSSAKGQEILNFGSDAFFGVAGIVIALCCDALLYIGEEKYCFAIYKTSNNEIILFIYGFASLNALATLVASGRTAVSVEYMFANQSFAPLVFGYSICNFVGTYFLLEIVSEFESNSAVVVTSLRKMVTVLLSYVIYPKPFGFMHGVGLICVCGGIALYESARFNSHREHHQKQLDADSEQAARDGENADIGSSVASPLVLTTPQIPR